MENKPSAREIAVLRLQIREYSSAEMIAYLKRKGYPADEARQTVAELKEEGLLDDRRYARSLTRYQSTRDRGPLYILNKLRTKGVRIELDEVRELFGEVSDADEFHLARKIIERRYPDANKNKNELAKAFQALLRRGFSRDVARKCLFQSHEPDEEADNELV